MIIWRFQAAACIYVTCLFLILFPPGPMQELHMFPDIDDGAKISQLPPEHLSPSGSGEQDHRSHGFCVRVELHGYPEL